MIITRPVALPDLPAVTAIYAEAVRNGTATYELEAPDLAEMTARHDALMAQGYPYLVAEDDGAILGYAYAGPFRARRAYRFMAEDSIYLAPEARGRGIGRVLLDRLVAQCDAQGFRQVVAVIGDGSSNHASVRLHAAAGFRHSGVLEGSGYKHGRWLDTTFMQITLNGGTSTAPDREPLRI
ncbi:MAG: N-acetyltransferase [Notoacmeibacter sp.]|nr:N-acetyltransferase [Notoacmeibacter sp.]MCC0033316.1 N-acetyltransferase [Brucellaceae bacterium]